MVSVFSVRGFAKVLMGKFVTLGLSSRAITRDLVRRFGRAYRRKDLLADIREAKGFLTHEGPLRNLGINTRPPESLMTEMSLRRPRRYRVMAEMQYLDPETGNVLTKNVSWYDNKLATPAEWEDDYITKGLSTESAEIMEVYSIEITQIQHNETWAH